MLVHLTPLAFSASMPIFTGGLTSSQIRAALERNNADRLTLEGTRRNVLQTVSQAWNQLLGARAGLVSNQEQVRATTLAYEGVKQEQQVGLRTTIDVLNAEQELRNAEFALVGSRRDEYVAATAVLSAMGLTVNIIVLFSLIMAVGMLVRWKDTPLRWLLDMLRPVLIASMLLAGLASSNRPGAMSASRQASRQAGGQSSTLKACGR